MNHRVLITTILLGIQLVSVFSQELSSDVALKKILHGNGNVNLPTGILSYNHLLYTLTEGEYKLPISAVYSSNGFKPNDNSGRLGIGWSLNAGGVITRVMRGSHYDEEREGYLNIDIPNPVDENFKERVNKGLVDGEADVFYARFGGKVASFILGKDQQGNIEAHLTTQDNIKIECEISQRRREIISFTITDTDGVKYLFNEKEYTCFATWQPKTGGKNQLKANFPTAWYISEICTPNNGKILFDYASSVAETSGNESPYYYWFSGNRVEFVRIKAKTNHIEPEEEIDNCIANLINKRDRLSFMLEKAEDGRYDEFNSIRYEFPDFPKLADPFLPNGVAIQMAKEVLPTDYEIYNSFEKLRSLSKVPSNLYDCDDDGIYPHADFSYAQTVSKIYEMQCKNEIFAYGVYIYNDWADFKLNHQLHVVMPKLLKRIKTETKELLFCLSSGNNDYNFESSHEPMRYKALHVVDQSGNVNKIINFRYSDIKSFSKPKYLLCAIENIYPKSGKKESFDYSYFGDDDLNSERDNNDVDLWGYYNGKENWKCNSTLKELHDYFRNFWDGRDLSDGSLMHSANEDMAKLFVLQKVSIPSGSYVEFDYESNRFGEIIDGKVPITGGLRVKQKKIVADEKELVVNYKYYGGSFDLSAPTETIEALNEDVVFHTRPSQYSNQYVFNKGNNGIWYSKVCVETSENGKVIYKYPQVINPFFYLPSLNILKSVQLPEVGNLLLEKFILDEQGQLLHAMKNKYSLNEDACLSWIVDSDAWFSFVDDQRNSIKTVNQVKKNPYYMDEEALTKKFPDTEVLVANQPNYYIMQNPYKDNYIVNIEPRIGQNSSANLVYETKIGERSLLLSESSSEYKGLVVDAEDILSGDITYDYLLSNNTEKLVAKNVISYHYRDPEHVYPTHIIRDIQDYQLIERFKYPLSYSKGINEGIDLLVKKNMVGMPIETQLWKRTISTGKEMLLSSQINNFEKLSHNDNTDFVVQTSKMVLESPVPIENCLDQLNLANGFNSVEWDSNVFGNIETKEYDVHNNKLMLSSIKKRNGLEEVIIMDSISGNIVFRGTGVNKGEVACRDLFIADKLGKQYNHDLTGRWEKDIIRIEVDWDMGYFVNPVEPLDELANLYYPFGLEYDQTLNSEKRIEAFLKKSNYLLSPGKLSARCSSWLKKLCECVESLQSWADYYSHINNRKGLEYNRNLFLSGLQEKYLEEIYYQEEYPSILPYIRYYYRFFTLFKDEYAIDKFQSYWNYANKRRNETRLSVDVGNSQHRDLLVIFNEKSSARNDVCIECKAEYMDGSEVLLPMIEFTGDGSLKLHCHRLSLENIPRRENLVKLHFALNMFDIVDGIDEAGCLLIVPEDARFVTYSYDAYGNVVHQFDDNLQAVYFNYDDRGRLCGETNHENDMVMNYEHHGVGQNNWFFRISHDEININYEKNIIPITIYTSQDWLVNIPKECSWIKASEVKGDKTKTIKINCYECTGDSREGVISIIANGIVKRIKIYQDSKN